MATRNTDKRKGNSGYRKPLKHTEERLDDEGSSRSYALERSKRDGPFLFPGNVLFRASFCACCLCNQSEIEVFRLRIVVTTYCAPLRVVYRTPALVASVSLFNICRLRALNFVDSANLLCFFGCGDHEDIISALFSDTDGSPPADELDVTFGFEKINNSSQEESRLGWLINMHPVCSVF